MDLEFFFYRNWELWEFRELECVELKKVPWETSYWAPVITWALKIQQIGLGLSLPDFDCLYSYPVLQTPEISIGR